MKAKINKAHALRHKEKFSNIENASLSKIEEIEVRKETNYLKRLDQ